MAHAPVVLAAYAGMRKAIEEYATLDARTRTAVQLTVSTVEESDYSLAVNTMLSRRAGWSDDDIDAIRAGAVGKPLRDVSRSRRQPRQHLRPGTPTAVTGPFPINVDRGSQTPPKELPMTQSNPIPSDAAPTTVLTRPSLFVRVCMRPMTRVLNPLIRRVAGGRHMSMAAQIHHRGRRSGRLFVTPASARLHEGTFWIPLTFGTGSDWCRNVLSAGECAIRWKGEEFVATRPVVVDRATALSAAGRAFKPQERMMMRLIGIKHFLRLDLARP